jgi:hypothetical protein
MYEVTKDNYHTFLTWHGMDPEVAEWVVQNWADTEGYRTMGSVRLWVDASRMLLKEVNGNQSR